MSESVPDSVPPATRPIAAGPKAPRKYKRRFVHSELPPRLFAKCKGGKEINTLYLKFYQARRVSRELLPSELEELCVMAGIDMSTCHPETLADWRSRFKVFFKGQHRFVQNPMESLFNSKL